MGNGASSVIACVSLMSETPWIDFARIRPRPGQFVRVEVRERVEHHWIEFEGQARYDPERGWLTVDDQPYLVKDQEIRRWKPLLDSDGREEWDEFVGDLMKDASDD